MIITLFGGGLGNQMFQYAFGRSISIKNNQPFKLDYHRYEDTRTDSNKGDRIFELNKFNIVGEIASMDEIENFYKYYKPNTLIRRFFVKYYGYKYKNKPFYIKPFIMEPEEHYTNASFNLLDYKFKDVYIRGFWQSEKYFKEIEDIIRKDFTLKGKQNKEYYNMLSKIENSDSISVFVRRGDFVNLPELQKTYYECPPIFFQKAIDIIANKCKNPKIFITSDDIEWVKKNISFPHPTEYLNNSKFTDIQALVLMSACKHAILSNSTFAWWGGWLNQNPNKIIVTTKKWFLNEEKNKKRIEHLIPKSWIKI